MKGPKGKELPCVECGGKCCRYAPIDIAVWERVKGRCPPGMEIDLLFQGTPREAVVVRKPGTDGVCGFLVNGRCSIYSHRPRTCRLVGVVLACPEVDPESAIRLVQQMRVMGHRFHMDNFTRDGRRIL